MINFQWKVEFSSVRVGRLPGFKSEKSHNIYGYFQWNKVMKYKHLKFNKDILLAAKAALRKGLRRPTTDTAKVLWTGLGSASSDFS
jgi:hypothetical protein